MGQLAAGAHVSKRSLLTLARRWAVWKLIESYDVEGGPPGVRYSYTIGAAGRRYLRAAPKWYPFWQALQEEIAFEERKRVGWQGRSGWHVIAEPFEEETDYTFCKECPAGTIVVNGREQLFNAATLLVLHGKVVSNTFIHYVVGRIEAAEGKLVAAAV